MSSNDNAPEEQNPPFWHIALLYVLLCAASSAVVYLFSVFVNWSWHLDKYSMFGFRFFSAMLWVLWFFICVGVYGAPTKKEKKDGN